MLNMMKVDATKVGSQHIYESRAMLLMAWYAVALGGEVKSNSYTDWMHDPFFKVVDIGWIDIKTVHTYSMAMIPHRFNCRVDFYHAMACFFCVENGLFWKPDQKSCHQKVFPNLHNRWPILSLFNVSCVNGYPNFSICLPHSLRNAS
jgi:hypothetical protein